MKDSFRNTFPKYLKIFVVYLLNSRWALPLSNWPNDVLENYMQAVGQQNIAVRKKGI